VCAPAAAEQVPDAGGQGVRVELLDDAGRLAVPEGHEEDRLHVLPQRQLVVLPRLLLHLLHLRPPPLQHPLQVVVLLPPLSLLETEPRVLLELLHPLCQQDSLFNDVVVQSLQLLIHHFSLAESEGQSLRDAVDLEGS
jgi:hypothetical protein